MAKANDTDIYKYDLSISLMDYLFGTDSVDGKKNKSYRIKDIVQLINAVNGKNNLQFIYSDGLNPDISQYTTGCFFTDTLDGDPLNFTQLILNKSSLQPIDLTLLFQRLNELQDVVIKLDNPANPNNFFNFKVLSITDQTDYFVFDVAIFKDFYFGEFLNETIYSIYFDIKSATESDDLKLDKGDFEGDAGDLDDRIIVLENLQGLKTGLTGQAYAIWTGVGFVYDVIYPDYYINSILYSGSTTTITLDASDLVEPRRDTIALDVTGVIKVTGYAEPNPVDPTLDPETQIFITSVLISANTSVPADTTFVDVYKENVEWTGTSNFNNINFAATDSAIQGSVGIKATNFSNLQWIRFQGSTLYQPGDWDVVSFRVKLLNTFPQNTKFCVRLRNSTMSVSGAYPISDGQYGYSRANTGQWLYITVPLSSFTILDKFNAFEILMNGSNSSGFMLDNVQFSKGNNVQSPLQKAIVTITTDSGIANATLANDTIIMTSANNGLLISAIGKVITFTSLFTSAIKSGYDNAIISINSSLSNKVDKIAGKGLSTEDYTTSEKNKLASIDATHYLAPLQTTVQLSALPQAGISDKARVYVENDLSDYFYDVTASSGDIAPDDQVGGIGFWRKVAVGGETAASIKTKYESNPDTNAFTDAEQTLVATISGKEVTTNKTDTVTGNETSSSLFASIKGMVDWLTATKIRSILGISTLSGSNTGDSATPAETATTIGVLIGGSADATPNDTDFIATSLTAGGILKKITWTNAKAFLKTYFDTLYKTDTISVAMSDSSTALVTGDTDPLQAPYNFTLLNYWIGVKTAPTVSSLIVDVKKNGTSITSTKAGIDATEKTSLTGTSPVLTTTSFTKGDEITPNIYQVGSSETGRSLKLYLEIIKT
ncbi:MAG: hypothetical protein H7Y10_03560 [Flavobacterium sp.]|nr:hypothetical protein [Flavobacterium sp.]